MLSIFGTDTMFYFRKKDQQQLTPQSVQASYEIPLDDTMLPPTTGSVIGVALNDKALLASLTPAFHEAPYKVPPKNPVLYIKTDNTHIGHGATIQVPTDKGPVYAGPALGIVIGKTTRRVSESDAFSHIQGFTVVNEISLAETSFYRPAVKAKCRDSFCPIGPWMIDRDQVQHPDNLSIRTFVNDTLRHETNTQQMVYPINAIVSYISQFITLEAGDLIIAGTPERTDSLEIQPGDSVMVEIDGIGSLSNPVEAEPSTQLSRTSL